jgi:mono/diheme cytochrome c family protein
MRRVIRAPIHQALVALILIGGPVLCSSVLGRAFMYPRLHAQAAAVDDAKIWAGVYTAEQARRGEKTYEAFCTRCHGLDLLGSRNAGSGPALKDANFWVSWERAPLSSIFSKIQRTMPYDSPGSLRDDDYADLLSFILSRNAFPAGTSELAPTGLAEVRIVRPVGMAGEVPNFSLVQVVGCLARGPGDNWVLKSATAPQATRDDTPNAIAITDAARRPLGSAQLQLIGAGHFKPEASAGRRVEARGLLNKTSDDAALDVLSLQSVSENCAS